MMEQTGVSARGLAVMLFLMLATDMVVRPFSGEMQVEARTAVCAAAGNTAAAVLLSRPIAGALEQTGTARLRNGDSAASKLFLGICCIIFALAAGRTMVQAEMFFRYVSDDPIPRTLVWLLMLGIALYAIRCGTKATVRVFGLLAWIFAGSLVLLAVSNMRQFRIENLDVGLFDIGAVGTTMLRSVSAAPELLLFTFLSMRGGGRKKQALGICLAAAGVLFIALTVGAELVLGSRVQTQIQTVHTLSRLGRISVFRRFDALHVAVWMMMEFAKAAVFALGLQQALYPLIGRKAEKYAWRWVLLFLVAAVLCAQSLSEPAIRTVLFAATGASLLGMTLYGYGIGRKHEAQTKQV